MFIVLCGTGIPVERKKCIKKNCKGNVICDDDEKKCLTCGELNDIE